MASQMRMCDTRGMPKWVRTSSLPVWMISGERSRVEAEQTSYLLRCSGPRVGHNDQVPHPDSDGEPDGASALPNMITAADVTPLLLEACPSFLPVWQVVEAENRDEEDPGSRLGYLDAGEFIRHLVSLRLENRLEEFPDVFAVIERMVDAGDAYVQELSIIGYLEGMQMATVTSAGLDPERDFRPYCSPVLDRWWDRLNRFWAGDVTALREPEA